MSLYTYPYLRPKALVVAVLYALAEMQHGPGERGLYLDHRHGLRVRV